MVRGPNVSGVKHYGVLSSWIIYTDESDEGLVIIKKRYPDAIIAIFISVLKESIPGALTSILLLIMMEQILSAVTAIL